MSKYKNFLYLIPFISVFPGASELHAVRPSVSDASKCFSNAVVTKYSTSDQGYGEPYFKISGSDKSYKLKTYDGETGSYELEFRGAHSKMRGFQSILLLSLSTGLKITGWCSDKRSTYPNVWELEISGN